MKRMAFFLLLGLSVTACRSTKEAGVTSEIGEPVTIISCKVLVKFQSDEALKRLTHKLESYRLEILQEVSSSDHIYKVNLNCKEGEAEGFIYKLEQENGVEWAKLLQE